MFIEFQVKLVMLFYFFIWIISGSLASAQMVGNKDLTQELSSLQAKSKTNPPSQDYCPQYGGHSDGDIINQNEPVLTLSITKAELTILDKKPGINLTIMLKNQGTGQALVPWSSSPVEPSKIDFIDTKAEKNMKTIGYDVATIDFFLGRPFSKDNTLGLQYYVALWSQPGNLDQSINIRAGEWLDLNVRVNIICRSSDSTQCAARLHENKLQVSAWWYQRELTTTYKDSCIYETAAYTQRMIQTTTVEVNSTPLPTSQKVDVSQPSLVKHSE
jgi:hypothetical protein